MQSGFRETTHSCPEDEIIPASLRSFFLFDLQKCTFFNREIMLRGGCIVAARHNVERRNIMTSRSVTSHHLSPPASRIHSSIRTFLNNLLTYPRSTTKSLQRGQLNAKSLFLLLRCNIVIISHDLQSRQLCISRPVVVHEAVGESLAHRNTIRHL